MTAKRVRVGDVLRLRRDKIEPDMTQEYRQIGVYSWGKGIIENDPISGTDLSKVSYYRFPINALILSNIQAWEAAIAVSEERHHGFIASQRFLPYIPIRAGEVDVRYLCHYFLSDHGMVLIRKASPGSVTRNRTLGKAAFENLEVPLPGLDEQRAIAAHLDAVVRVGSRVSDREAFFESRLKALRQRIVERALDGAPLVPAKDALNLARRAAEIKPLSSYREIGVRSFGRGLFHKDPIIGADLGNKRVFHIQPADLVISNVFAWEGAVAVASDNESGMIGSHRFMTWVSDKSQLNPRFAYYYLTSPRGVAALAAASPGSAGRNRTLSINAFKELRIPIPALTTQQAAVDKLDNLAHLAELLKTSQVIATALPRAARNEVFAAL